MSLQEKGYRDYGHDIDNTDNILECGLGFTCDFEKVGGFVGQEHVERQRQLRKEQGGLRKRMAHVLVKDPEPLLDHAEVVLRNGQAISEIRSASYGHTLQGAVGLTMLESALEPINNNFVTDAVWEVDIAGTRFPCEVSFAPFYDPKNTRIKI